LIFLTLKLAGLGVVATWSWWWVTAPLWIPLGAILVISAIIGLVVYINSK
jgi:fatty acid desaturase